MVYNGFYKMIGWIGINLLWILKKNNDYWDKKVVKMDSIKY